jgi:nucleoside 2-deoxyribosyltransferase
MLRRRRQARTAEDRAKAAAASAKPRMQKGGRKDAGRVSTLQRSAVCPICNRDVKVRDVDQSVFVDGPQCGRFFLTLAGYSDILNMESDQRSALSCATRQASEDGRSLTIPSKENAKDFAESHSHTRVAENQMRLLREVAKRAKRPDGRATFEGNQDFTLIDCFSAAEFSWYLTSLEEKGLLIYVAPGPMHTGSHRLSPEGWKQVQPLPRPGGIPGRCFVAMSFAPELQDAYDLGIKPAIEDAGFSPTRADLMEHNNEITDEIIAGIRDAQFVVADFTKQRSGVYYEAGFAMGLGRPVVWCCAKKDVDQLHFDTNHKNHIVWETPEELREKLRRRIKATIIEQA